VWAGCAGIAVGQVPPPPELAEKRPVPQWLLDRELTVSAASVPYPALKYRLFPLHSERKDGNAVPIYLRLNHGQADAARNLWIEEPEKWNKLPLDKIPLDEAKKFMEQFARFYQQFDFGARRKSAEWNYTVDQPSVVDIGLPDTQSMRSFVPMMILKVRVEAAEGNYPASVRMLETCFSFSQQISEAPFLVSALVGIASASLFADALADVIERPDAPSLYWALTALPRPLIDLRKGMEFEQRFLDMQYPELADLDRQRTKEQWDAVLVRIRREERRLSDINQLSIPRLSDRAPEDPADKSPDLRLAKAYLVDRVGLKSKTVDAMPAAQVLVLWIARYAREAYDDNFKASYLPYPQARVEAAAAEERVKSALAFAPLVESEAARFLQTLLPVSIKVLGAQCRLERKLAMLRIVEALRLHAEANDGTLPDRLDQITVVPIPHDPGTGKPFEYERKGATATLASRIPGERLDASGLRYRITLRK
jgi:hypothetical protein